MKNKTILTITILAISLFIIPQMTFASWWKPNTWKIFNRKSEVKTEQKIIATSTLNKIKSEDISNVVKDDANLGAEAGKLITPTQTKKESELPKTTDAGGGSPLAPVTSGARPVVLTQTNGKQESVEKQKIAAMQAQIEEIKRSIEQTLKNQKNKEEDVKTKNLKGQIKEAEPIDKEIVLSEEKQKKSSKQKNSALDLALTYEQRHCPRVVHIEDNLGNSSDGSSLNAILSAPTTPNTIILRVDVEDPQANPIVYWWGTNFPSADLNQPTQTSTNTFNIDFSNRRIGHPGNQIYIHFKNNDGYNCAGIFYNSDGEAMFNYMVFPQN